MMCCFMASPTERYDNYTAHAGKTPSTHSRRPRPAKCRGSQQVTLRHIVHLLLLRTAENWLADRADEIGTRNIPRVIIIIFLFIFISNSLSIVFVRNECLDDFVTAEVRRNVRTNWFRPQRTKYESAYGRDDTLNNFVR